MAFVNEEILREEDKKLFASIGFTNMFEKPLNPRRWTIDRERKIILVRRGGGSFEVPRGYMLYIDGELVEIEVTEGYEGSEVDKTLKVYWFVKKIEAPKRLLENEEDIEKLKQVIKEAFLGLGTEGVDRDELLGVFVKIINEPVCKRNKKGEEV